MTKCANFNLPQYPKLDAYLKDKLGNGSINYTTAISFIDDDLFINMIDTNKINIEQQVNKAYESLIKAVAIRTNNPALLSKINDDSTNYSYLTDKAKKDAIKFVRGQLNHFIFQNKLVNRKERINDLLNHLIVYFTGNKNTPGLISYILDTITKNNPQAKEEFNKLFEVKEESKTTSSENINKFFKRFAGIRGKLTHEDEGKLAKITKFINKYGTSKQYNAFRTFINISNPEFIKAVKITGDFIKYESNEQQDYSEEDLGDRLNLEDLIDGNEYEEGAVEDLMAKNWSHGIGETKDWKDHMSELCKSLLNSLLKLNSTNKRDFNRDNELGLPTFDNGQYLAKLLYSIPNKVNVDDFLNSIYRIATTNAKAHSLITLYDKLIADRHLAMAFMKDFNLYVTTKSEAIVSSDAQNDTINFDSRITNTDAKPSEVLYKRYISDVKNAIVSEQSKLIDDLYNTAVKSKTKNDLYKAVKFVFKDITEEEFNYLINNRGAKTYDERLSEIQSKFNDVVIQIRNSNEVLQAYKIAKKPIDDNIVTSKTRTAILNFARFVADYINIPIKLTSRNSLGKQSSDVIDRNYLNVIENLIQAHTEDNPTADAFAEQKFASPQYIYSNYLISHPGTNYGLFRKDGDKYVLTPYAKSMFKVTLTSGIINTDSYEGNTYNNMSDSDYLAMALSFFVKSDLTGRVDTITPRGKSVTLNMGTYLFPIPSDAPKNFTITGPRYFLITDNNYVDINGIHFNKIIFNQFMNIVKQEIVNMHTAASKMFTIKNGVVVESELLKNNPNQFYKTLHYQVDKKTGRKVFYKKVGNYLEPIGEIFKLKRLTDTSVANDYFKDLVGVGKPFDILYGGSIEAKFDINGELIMTEGQKTALENAVKNFMYDLYNNSENYLRNKYKNIIGNYSSDVVKEFYFNDFLIRDSINDIFAGDIHLYDDMQKVLKRIKHVQGSGKPFGNVDYTENAFTPTKNQLDTGVSVYYTDIDGKQKTKKVILQNNFNGITIANTVTPARKEVQESIRNLLTKAGCTEDDITRILKPYVKPAATNDAQSWITLEEWIRRITAAGEFPKYKSLIEKLTNSSIPVEDITKEELNNFIQIQKNFYFDLYYDPIIGHEVARQVKNAEFVLVPKLIKGTELEEVYNIMMRNNIHQLNTVETVKVAQHNILQLWDDNGIADLEDFEKQIQQLIINKGVDRFSYNYLYRQQEVPQHMIDERNKAGIQIMKKILDNLDTNKYPELAIYVQNIFDSYCANIETNFREVCEELGIKVDKKGNIVLNEDGSINVDKKIFLERFKENAARQNADDTTLEYFDTDENGEPLFPLFASALGNKLESIANSYFNANITKQLINGWHAAQLSDFGFVKLNEDKSKIKTDTNLKYKILEDGIVYSEIYLPRWAKELANVNLNEWYEIINKENPIEEEVEKAKAFKDILTMIGYRIPTEGKQSVVVFRVVPFPGSEDGFIPSSYGSTVVVPYEFVHQTGSDFDVDSVYAMIKSFYINNKGIPVVDRINNYTEDVQGYLRYLRGNIDKAARKELKNYFGKGDTLNEVIIKRKGDFETKIFQASENFNKLESVAKEFGLLNYNDYLKTAPVLKASKTARNNEIVENFIKILSHPGAYEENAMVSGFDHLSGKNSANEKWSKIIGADKVKVGPSGFITQLNWQDAATSGIKLKGISVNFDTLASICNVAKAVHSKGIRVAYNKELIDSDVANSRFGSENVDSTGERIIITHKQIGWSHDNKNIEGYLVNPYSSETTAHILDVMKEGAIRNENTYTFAAFKAITLLGSNFDTAVGFMHQPAVDFIVKSWKDGNSVANYGKTNPIQAALRKYAIELGIKEEDTHVSDVELLAKVDRLFMGENEETNPMAVKYLGVSKLTTAFMYGGCIFNSALYEKRHTGQLSASEKAFLDICATIQFVELNEIGQDMSNNVNAIKADKYGAKATFFETEKVFRDIQKCIDDSNIYVYGKDQKLVSAIFPGVEGGYKEYINSDISGSIYPSLAYFLKYATATSIKTCQQIFATASEPFMNYVYEYSKLGYNGSLNFNQYNAIKNFVIRGLMTIPDSCDFVNLPTTISKVTGEFALTEETISDKAIAQENEMKRLCGATFKTTNFVVKDLHNPSQEEIDNFSKLTPLEKINFIKDNFTGINYFGYIEVSAYDERSNRKNKYFQFIRFLNNDLDINEVHLMFNSAFTNPNPFVRLAALDCVKYANIVEGRIFRPTNVMNSLSNLPMYPSSTGGVGLTETLNTNIKNIGFSTADVINFVRANPFVFNFRKFTYKSFTNLGIKFKLEPDKSISFTNNKIFSVANHPAFIRVFQDIYVAHDYLYGDQYLDANLSERLTYIPLNGLEEFETNAGIDNSIFIQNNKYNSLRTFGYKTKMFRITKEKLYAQVSENIIEGLKNKKLLASQIFANKFNKEAPIFTPMFKQGVENNVVYEKPHDVLPEYYIGITGNKAIAMSSDLAELRNKYKGANENDFAILVRFNQNLINQINNNEIIPTQDIDVVFAETFDGQTVTDSDRELARAHRETLVYIADEAKTNDEYSQRLLSKFRISNIDAKSIEQIASNKAFANTVIEDYIINEAARIIDGINDFIIIDGEHVAIDDERVLDKIKDNPILESQYLKIILGAASFKNKYELYEHIDLSTLDDKSAKLIENITKVINKMNANNRIHTILKNWMLNFAGRYTTNPQIKENLANILVSFGDTSFADKYFQDIHFNKDPTVQLIVSEFENRLELARRNGITEANNFKAKIAELSKRSNPRGGQATIASVVDNKGRLIRKYTEAWDVTRQDLKDDIEIKKAVYGENSLEHLRSKYNYEKFLADTTVHKLKNVKDINNNLEEVDLNYEQDRLLWDNVLLNKKGEYVANRFAEFKQLLHEINLIYNYSPTNVLNDAEQKRISELISKIDSLTSPVNDDGTQKVGESYTTAILINKYREHTKELREKFFDYTVAPGFEEKLKQNLEVINRRETQRDANGNLLINREELMNIEEYRDAKMWLRNNAKAINTKIIDLSSIFDELGSQYKQKSKSTVAIKEFNARDEFGIVDGRLIPDDRIAEIRQQTIDNFRSHQVNGMPYAGIIRATPIPNVVVTKYFYQQLNSGRIASADEVKVGEEINKILEKYWDYNTKELRTWEIPIDELLGVPNGETNPDKKTKLGLIDYIKSYDSLELPSGPDGKRVAQFIENECIVEPNYNIFNSDESQAKVKGYTYYQAWKKVFVKTNEDGSEEPRSVFYSTIMPKGYKDGTANKLFIDYDKTDAKQELEANFVSVETPYYWMKRKEVAEASGGYGSEGYKKWYKENHYWNPYERRYVPLRIWTTNESNVAISNNPDIKWEPRTNNLIYAPKQELLNEDYNKSGVAKYKLGTGYDNTAYLNLNDVQHEIISEIEKVLNKAVITNSNQRYVDEGYMPAIAQSKKLGINDIPKEAAKFIGYYGKLPDNISWKSDDEVTFEKDYDIPNQSLIQLRNSESVKLMEVPKIKNDNETNEEFVERKKAVLKHNREAIKKNQEIHAELINTNWDEVMDAFIKTSHREHAISINKNLLYGLDMMLRSYDVYDTASGGLKLDRKRSNESNKEYRTTKRKNTISQNKEYIRRQVFQQFKDINHPYLNYFGNLAQNITGSKYMMMNITGGIANVLIGSASIAMEHLAGEYVNKGSWLKARSEWIKGSVSFLSNMYSDKSTTIQDALIKESKVIDFDRLVELEANGANKYINRAKSLTYSPQTIGEHYMQSTMLFAMMDSHRIIDVNGENVVMDFDTYTREVEKEVFLSIVNSKPELADDWKAFNDLINNDNVLATEYITYKRNKYYDFAKKYFNIELKKEYKKTRKDRKKFLKEEFESAPKVYDQFELIDGRAMIKADSKLTDKMFAKFCNKVRLVNKKIHGVYDKIGAARIENQWYGGMVMQYHKHLYPGFKKRYRTNTYYNEILESIEKGSYISLLQFLGTPIRQMNGKPKNFNEACNAIKNLIKDYINFVGNIHIEYGILPEFEKANIRRNYADLLYTIAAVCGAIVICGLGDDDEDDILYHLALHQVDRLASEANAFTPWGILGEGKKLWSSPIAFQQSVKDALQTLNLSVGLLLNDNFLDEYTTGRYKGLNKFQVIVIRNAPIVRNIDRIIQMPRHNSYYKLQDNALGWVNYKAIAESIFD